MFHTESRKKVFVSLTSCVVTPAAKASTSASIRNAGHVLASGPAAVTAPMTQSETAKTELLSESCNAALAAKAALNDVQKTSGSGGDSV